MPIPHHFSKVVSALKDELDKAGGVGKSQDIIEKLAQRFQVTPAEREIRDPSRMRTFDHRVHAAVYTARRAGDIEPKEKSGRGIWKLTSKYWTMKRKQELQKRFEAVDGAINKLMVGAIVEEALARSKGGKEIKDELQKRIKDVKDAKDAIDKLKEFILGLISKEG